MERESGRRQIFKRVPWIAIVLFGGTLAVYTFTLSPGVLGGDVGELQFVPYILSMAHPTGTPLYCLIGWLWTRLSFGPSVAWQMNLLSAVVASLSVVVVYKLVHRCTHRCVPALVAALSFAFGPVFWEQATMADKYAFNSLLVALVLYLALLWGETHSCSTLNLLAFTYGLSLTHHRTMMLFAPILLGYVWWHERGSLWRDPWRLLRLSVLVLVPLLFYFYLPWAESRNLPPGSWHPTTLSDWLGTVVDTGSLGFLYIDPSDLGERLLFFAQTLRDDYTWPGLFLGLFGLLGQWRRKPADAVLLLVSFSAQGFLAANHHLPRQWTFFVPSLLIFALWVGEGLAEVWKGFERSGLVKSSTALGLTLALLMLALPAVPFRERYRSFRDAHLGAGVLDVWRQALKQGRTGERMGMAIAEVEPNAVIVGDWEQATPLWYYQQVEGLRPDVEILYPIERLTETGASGRPLYITRNHPALADHWHPSSRGPLVALQPRPVTVPPPEVSPLHIRFGDSFELIGFTYGQTEFHRAAVLPVTLHWRALQAPVHDYSVSLRLFDETGHDIYRVDSQHPVLGTYPTSLWTKGEVVSDYYEIQLPTDLQPGTYSWGVLLYRSQPGGGWENLTISGAPGDLAKGGTIEVEER